MERVLLVMRKVGHDVVVRMRYKGIAVRMTPVLAMVVRMVVHESRIPHSSRSVRDVRAVMPVGSEWALIIRDSRVQGRLEWRTHGPTEWTAIHLVRQKGLQRRYLVEHRVDLRQMLACESRSGLEVAAGAPFRHSLRIPSLAVVDAWRPERKVLLHSIGYVGLGGHGQQNVLGGMRLTVFLDRSAVIGSGENPVGCLAAKHMLCGFGSVARLGRLRAIRVVSRERVGVLLGYWVLGDSAPLERGSIAEGGSMWRGRGDVGVVGVVVGQRRGKLRRRGLRGILPNHSHGGGEPLEGLWNEDQAVNQSFTQLADRVG